MERELRRSGRDPDPVGWIAASVLVALGVGASTQGCKDARTRYVEVQSPAPPAPPPPAPVREVPATQLVSRHHADLGYGSVFSWEPHAPAGRWLPTNGGIMVWVPAAVEVVPGRAAELLLQVDATPPEPDTRLPAGARLPAGSRVIVLPGPFDVATGSQLPLWAVGLAGGPVWEEGGGRQSLACWVSWRPVPSERRLAPAYAHEARHLLTGDPMAGHPGGCCNAWMVGP